MKTEKLYYTAPYLRETEAAVVSVTEKGFLLDRSIFYPECGGQRGDSGSFGPYRIVTTVKDGEGNPVHVTSGPLPSQGDRYTLSLDWDERFFGMQEHTAQHLLSSILYKSYGIATVAVHQGKDEITIETDVSSILHDTLLKVEEEALSLIGENRKVWMEEMPREKAGSISRRSIKVDDEEVKVVFIENQDAVACGGVHLSSLGQIGELSFIREESIRSHSRTVWRVGKKARDFRRSNAGVLHEAEILLSSDILSVVPAIRDLIEENRQLRQSVKAYETMAGESEFNSHEGRVVVYSTRYNLDCLVERACSDTSRRIFITSPEKKFMFVGTKEEFMRLRSALSLRGGGRDPLFRGTYTQDDGEIISLVKGLLGS